MNKKIKNLAIIVAAGDGKRFGGELPKPYFLYKNKALLRYCLDVFTESNEIDAILTVIHPNHEEYYKKTINDINHKLLPSVIGGSERQESVYLALKAIRERGYNPEFIYIHDAARIYLTVDLIRKISQALKKYKACIPALDSVDTLKKIDEKNNLITQTVNRDLYKRAQTPQAFSWPEIYEAHKQQRGENLTDDAAVFEACGHAVKVIEGDARNIKITYPQDIINISQGEKMEYEYRMGIGYDVHAFTQGDHLWLGGIKLAYNKSLKGHSDADVALHAITDALLGAIADGDIGSHFPPSDIRWKAAASDQFLKYAMQRLKEKNGYIVNVDLTIIGEQPKIGPIREQIREKISEIIEVSIHRVSVKATTTEKLGFTGRKEGLAAQAVVNIKLSV